MAAASASQRSVGDGLDSTFLKSSTRIGSVRVRGSYKREEQAFHPGDVPDFVHTRRQHVKQLRRPAITGPHAKHKWNADVTVSKPLCVRQSAQLLDHDRSNYVYNYRAERLPSSAAVERDAFGRITACSLKQTARASEMEVNETLRSKPAWNDTTSFGGERERERMTARLNRRARKLTATTRGSVEGYVGPMERERQRMRLLRAQRAAAATASLEASSEFGGAGADSKAIEAMEDAGLTAYPPVSAAYKGKGAYGVEMSARAV